MVQLNMCQPLTQLQIIAVQLVCISPLHITGECSYDFIIFSNISLYLLTSRTSKEIDFSRNASIPRSRWFAHMFETFVRIDVNMTNLQCEKELNKDLSFNTCVSLQHNTVLNAIVSMRTRSQCATSINEMVLKLKSSQIHFGDVQMDINVDAV